MQCRVSHVFKFNVFICFDLVIPNMNITSLIASNPFRILGVFTNSGAKDISSNIGKFKAFSAIGKQPSFSVDFDKILTPVSRTQETMDKACLDVATPEKKLSAGMFWFFKNQFFEEHVMPHLKNDDQAEQAVALLQQHLNESKDIIDMQNLLLLYLIRGDYSEAVEIAVDLYGAKCTEFQNMITPILKVKKQYFIERMVGLLNEQNISVRDLVRKPELLKWKKWLELDKPSKSSELSGNASISYYKSVKKFLVDIEFILAPDWGKSIDWGNFINTLPEDFFFTEYNFPSAEDVKKAGVLLKQFKKDFADGGALLSLQINDEIMFPVCYTVIRAIAGICQYLIKQFEMPDIDYRNEESFRNSAYLDVVYSRTESEKTPFYTYLTDFLESLFSFFNDKSIPYNLSKKARDLVDLVECLLDHYNHALYQIRQKNTLPKEVSKERIIRVQICVVFALPFYNVIRLTANALYGTLNIFELPFFEPKLSKSIFGYLYYLESIGHDIDDFDDVLEEMIIESLSDPSMMELHERISNSSQNRSKKPKRKKKAMNGRNNSKKKKKKK